MTAAPKKKSAFRRWKRRALDAGFHALGAPALGGALSLLSRTCKLDFRGYEHYAGALKSGRPVVLAFFHEDMFSIFLAHIRVHPCRLGVMISHSRDGEMLARLIERYDLIPVRASSSRGAVRGFLELYRWLVAKRDFPTLAAIAVDGPRGPRRVAKTGAAMLARKAGALILPVVFDQSRKFVFRSWDRTMLPKPFARTTILIHEPLDTAAWSDDDESNARQLGALLVSMKAELGLP